MIKKVLLLTYFITLFCNAQNNTVPVIKKIIITNNYLKAHKNDSLAEFAHTLSIRFYKKHDYKNAIKYANIEIKSLIKLNDSSNRYKKALFNKGLFLSKDKQYNKSLKYFAIVIDSFNINERTYRTYCKIGDIYRELGDYYHADNYFKKGLSNINVFSSKKLFRHYNNYSAIQEKIESTKSLQKEIQLLKKMDSLSSLFKLSKNDFYALNFGFANYYKNDLTFDFKKSKHYYLKVLKKSIERNDLKITLSVNLNLAALLNKTKNDSALYYINKGFHISKKLNLYLPNSYYRLGEYYFNNKDYTSAQKYNNKALKSISQNQPTQNLTINNLITSSDKINLFHIIKHKAIILLKIHDQSKNQKHLELALKNIHLTDKILDAIKQESIETQSKLFWQKEASEIYIQGVKTAYLLNKPEDAFYFMEKNKALLLLENISENNLRRQTNIPTTILEEELNLKQKINSLENELNNNNNTVKKDSLKNKYYSTKITLSDYIKSLKTTYPSYYKYKKPIDIIGLQDVQKKLDAKTMVLEYILDDVEGYVLAITKDKTSLHKIDSIKELNAKIELYRSLISQPISTQEKQHQYNTIAQELYNSLFPFSKNELSQKIDKLVIIPDYTLQNIPFEPLKTSNNRYLINDYEISYVYSLSFLEKNKTPQNPTKNYIGFAPYNFEYDNLSSLKNSKKEVLTANNYFSGTILTDSLATKDYFVSNSMDYKIIHLATHATVNDSTSLSWIAFKKQKLFENEIYTLKNNADLVVLSACKTSLGKINKGEGVFSLARGFFYAGSKSVVSSLWNVNDKSSQEILSDFYANLKDRKTKSEALRQAKLNYINTHKLSEQSPYYWSSFILIGDTSTISISSFSDYYPYLFMLILIVLGFFLYKTVKK